MSKKIVKSLTKNKKGKKTKKHNSNHHPNRSRSCSRSNGLNRGDRRGMGMQCAGSLSLDMVMSRMRPVTLDMGESSKMYKKYKNNMAHRYANQKGKHYELTS